MCLTTILCSDGQCAWKCLAPSQACNSRLLYPYDTLRFCVRKQFLQSTNLLCAVIVEMTAFREQTFGSFQNRSCSCFFSLSLFPSSSPFVQPPLLHPSLIVIATVMSQYGRVLRVPDSSVEATLCQRQTMRLVAVKPPLVGRHVARYER